MSRRVLSAATLSGYLVRNREGEDLACIEELMVAPQTGTITFAVLSPTGVARKSGELLVVPWSALDLDDDQRAFILNVGNAALEGAPAFSEEQWPDFSDQQWTSEVNGYYAQFQRVAA